MRVLLTNLPPLLRDILAEALAGEPDLEIVGAGSRADVVILQGDRDAVASIDAAVVVAIEPSGQAALVLRAGDKPVELHDVSPTAIIMALRRTA